MNITPLTSPRAATPRAATESQRRAVDQRRRVVRAYLEAASSGRIVSIDQGTGNSMVAELCRVLTEDGLWLDGAWSAPESRLTLTAMAASQKSIDGCLLVHGTGSNFYAPGVLESFAGQCAAAGIPALRINTRGHDGISSISGQGRSLRGGATYEHVGDCPVDLHAWLDEMGARGCTRIALVGHSMGGVKSAYTMAHRPHPLVKALVMISAPCFNHARFQAHPMGTSFREGYQKARRALDDGRPEELIFIAQPMPFLGTASGIVDKYGPQDLYDWSELLKQVNCPTLYVLGSLSPQQSIGFHPVPELLNDLVRQNSNLTWQMVDGANINYTGQQSIPFEIAQAWWSELPPVVAIGN